MFILKEEYLGLQNPESDKHADEKGINYNAYNYFNSNAKLYMNEEFFGDATNSSLDKSNNINFSFEEEGRQHHKNFGEKRNLSINLSRTPGRYDNSLSKQFKFQKSGGDNLPLTDRSKSDCSAYEKEPNILDGREITSNLLEKQLRKKDKNEIDMQQQIYNDKLNYYEQNFQKSPVLSPLNLSLSNDKNSPKNFNISINSGDNLESNNDYHDDFNAIKDESSADNQENENLNDQLNIQVNGPLNSQSNNQIDNQVLLNNQMKLLNANSLQNNSQFPYMNGNVLQVIPNTSMNIPNANLNLANTNLNLANTNLNIPSTNLNIPNTNLNIPNTNLNFSNVI